MYECLQVEGYGDRYSAVQCFEKAWKRSRSAISTIKQAFVLLLFQAGETCQFDWSREPVIMGGLEHVVKVAHFQQLSQLNTHDIKSSKLTINRLIDNLNQTIDLFSPYPLRDYEHT